MRLGVAGRWLRAFSLFSVADERLKTHPGSPLVLRPCQPAPCTPSPVSWPSFRPASIAFAWAGTAGCSVARHPWVCFGSGSRGVTGSTFPVRPTRTLRRSSRPQADVSGMVPPRYNVVSVRSPNVGSAAPGFFGAECVLWGGGETSCSLFGMHGQTLFGGGGPADWARCDNVFRTRTVCPTELALDARDVFSQRPFSRMFPRRGRSTAPVDAFRQFVSNSAEFPGRLHVLRRDAFPRLGICSRPRRPPLAVIVRPRNPGTTFLACFVVLQRPVVSRLGGVT